MDSALSAIDGIVFIIVLLSAILAMAQGFTREVLSIASVSLALVLATHLSPVGASLLTGLVDIEPLTKYVPLNKDMLSHIMAGAGLFLLIWIIFSIINHRLSGWVENSAVGGVDRFLGFGFGACRGLFLVGVVYIMYTYMTVREKYPPILSNAHALPFLDGTAKTLANLSNLLLPDEFSNGLKQHLENHKLGIISKNTQPKNITSPLQDGLGKFDMIQKIITEYGKNPDAYKTTDLPDNIKKLITDGNITPQSLPKLDTQTLEAILKTMQTGQTGTKNSMFGTDVSKPSDTNVNDSLQTRP